MWPFSSPTKILPRPTATPCQDGDTSARHVHNVSPVLASSAYTLVPAVTYMTPSFTTGADRVDAPCSNFFDIHAPPSFLTVTVFISLSVEYRSMLQSP